MHVEPREHGRWWVTIDEAGRVVAAGERAMCELVAAGLPLIGHAGDLLTEGNEHQPRKGFEA